MNLITGHNNTAIGFQALINNDFGDGNTAIGRSALAHNTTGSFNTASGGFALFYNTVGVYNTATGSQVLQSNTTGFANTATGVGALFYNTTGYANTATGDSALQDNTTGWYNTGNGTSALAHNTTGVSNTADGLNALYNNTTGNNNTADGFSALFNNTTGDSNIALGAGAGQNLTTGSNNIEIGNPGGAFAVPEADTIRIGTVGTQQATFIAGISGKTVPGGVTVVVGANGHLGTVVSSRRFKEEIKPMDKASEAILALKPVTFRYKQELDPEGMPQFGLVAEEVEKVSPDLVARDDEGKVYTVRYEAVNAMLLNEFLKEHKKVDQQEATIAQLKATVAQQQKGMDLLTASVKEQVLKIQKVSDQLEVRRPAPQLVKNNQ